MLLLLLRLRHFVTAVELCLLSFLTYLLNYLLTYLLTYLRISHESAFLGLMHCYGFTCCHLTVGCCVWIHALSSHSRLLCVDSRVIILQSAAVCGFTCCRLTVGFCVCCCSEFLCTLQLDVKDDPAELLTSVCPVPDRGDKSSDTDIISQLFEGQVVNLVCISRCLVYNCCSQFWT